MARGKCSSKFRTNEIRIRPDNSTIARSSQIHRRSPLKFTTDFHYR